MNNFYEAFAGAAERFADRVAVEAQGRDSLERFTYGELRRMAERAAADLAGRGLDAGERAAILADNHARWCAAYLAILRLGGVAVPLDTAYKPQQIASLLADSGANFLFAGAKYQAAAEEAVRLAGTPCQVLPLDGAARPGEPLRRSAPPLPSNPAQRDDPAVILYTSGTTSDPKGVVLTHGNLLAEKEAVFQVVRLDERDGILGVLPLFHALAQMANLLLPFSLGARVVFLEALNSTELLRALRGRSITAFCCVPQFFYLIHDRVAQEIAAAGAFRRAAFRALLAANGWLRDLAGVNAGKLFFHRVHRVLGGSMRLLVTGGSRFDPGIARQLYRLGFDLLQAYGLTESSGAATVTRPGGRFTTSVGTPLPGVELKIAPPAAPAANHPGEGEILIRGPIVMRGYFNRAAASAQALEDGWLHTGDLGYLDAAGQLHITGRSKEIIILSSAKNIYPEEIEAHYSESHYIQELCVMGLAREGEPAAERLHAVVVPNLERMRARGIVNLREILRFEIEGLSIHLPHHKRILSYEIWTEPLPRTSTRKLQRFAIERRVREAASRAEPSPARESDADRAWAARPEVARALALVREAVRQPGAVRADANIELDLGLDSMERVELLTRLEQLFGTEVPAEAAQRLYTVRELVEACLPGAATRPCRGAADDPWRALLEAPREGGPELARLLRPKWAAAFVLFAVMKLGYGFARLALRLRVAGRENLPRQGAFLICPNHQSYLDPFLLVSALPFGVFRRLFFVGASEYFATPLRRQFARLINVVPVDPDTNLVRAMQAGAFGLRYGKVLVLFPEGERSIDGTVKKFKKGAPILSLHLSAPIVPVALDGVYGLWPRGRPFRWRALLPGSGLRMRLRFGEPIEPPSPLPQNASLAQAEEHYAAAADKLRAVVLAMWEELHRAVQARRDSGQVPGQPRGSA